MKKYGIELANYTIGDGATNAALSPDTNSAVGKMITHGLGATKWNCCVVPRNKWRSIDQGKETLLTFKQHKAA